MKVKVTIDYFIEDLCSDDDLKQCFPADPRSSQIEKMAKEMIEEESIIGIAEDAKGTIINVVEVEISEHF